MATNTAITSLTPFKLEIGGLTLLKDTKLTIAPELKYGLVGRNGTGKSTLLRYINDTYKSSHNIYYVEQEIESSEESILMTVLSSNIRLVKLLKKEKELEDLEDIYTNDLLLEKLEKVRDELEYINPGKEKSIVHRILYGLGFDGKEHDLPVSSFSGGWRMRVSLAKALYHKPDYLLLDEPTNHLDLNAVIWLKSYLENEFEKALLVVSHDVSFLNSVVDNIIYLNSQKKTLEYFRGNYVKFDKMRKINERKQEKDWKTYQKKISKLKAGNIKTGKLRAGKSKAGKIIERPEKKYEPKILFRNPVFPKNKMLDILKLKNASVRYGDGEYVLENINLKIKMNSRIVIVGKNGSGKSTFLKALTGKLKISLQNSSQMKSDFVRIGYFHQHFEEIFDFSITPIKYLTEKYSENQETVRRQLGIIGIPGKQHKVTIGQLSGGQKARLALVDIIMNEPHLIILDEPTNHLDIETIDSLIESINSFNGSIVMVTHNSDLIYETNCEIYIVDEKAKDIAKFNGDFDDYSSMVLEEINSAKET